MLKKFSAEDQLFYLNGTQDGLLSESWDFCFFNDLLALMPLHGQNTLRECAPRPNTSR